MDRVQAAFDARDWPAMRAACAVNAKIEDRRRHALISGDTDWWVADAQRTCAQTADVRYERRLVATAGDRVCLERTLWRGGPPTAPVEIEYLRLTEVDDAGQIVAVVGFDLDDRGIADREAWARWLAADAAAADVLRPLLKLRDAWNDRDLRGLRDVIAGDFVMDDRRLTGQGRLEGADVFSDALVGLWRLVPDIRIDPLIAAPAHDRHGSVTIGRDTGTFPDGGPFERYRVVLATVARGRLTRLEFFEIEDIDRALARFAELSANLP